MKSNNETLKRYLYAILDSYETSMLEIDLSYAKEKQIQIGHLNKLTGVLQSIDHKDYTTALQVNNLASGIYEAIIK